jgi:pimeloyl-ACP methyl ester carboxylesterase
MTQPSFSLVPILDHEVHVTEWGDPSNPAIVMWHGLARTGRDFDELAAALSGRYFVICPDTIGRGLSSWATAPDSEYSLEFLSQIADALLDHYSIRQAGWIGTSMGGIIGLRMASGVLANRLKWLIVNDIGPEIPEEAIERILTYVGNSPSFPTVSEAELWLRTVYAPFGPASDAFWRRMARTSVRRLENGDLTTHYDPRIVAQFTASRNELTSWDRFARVALPLHVIAGETSDILPTHIMDRMQTANPGMGLTVLQGIGHAPTLSRAEDIEMIRGIIAKLETSLGD